MDGEPVHQPVQRRRLRLDIEVRPRPPDRFRLAQRAIRRSASHHVGGAQWTATGWCGRVPQSRRRTRSFDNSPDQSSARRSQRHYLNLNQRKSANRWWLRVLTPPVNRKPDTVDRTVNKTRCKTTPYSYQPIPRSRFPGSLARSTHWANGSAASGRRTSPGKNVTRNG